MLNRIVFLNNLERILVSNSLKPEASYIRLVYEEIKNFFDDDDFVTACTEVIRYEKLYGKLPSVNMFISYAKQKPLSKEKIKDLRRQLFLNKIGEYLSVPFYTSKDKEEAISSFSVFESYVLEIVGGISKLWEQAHHDNYSRSINNILKDMGELFDSNYDLYELEFMLGHARQGEISLCRALKLSLVKLEPIKDDFSGN